MNYDAAYNMLMAMHCNAGNRLSGEVSVAQGAANAGFLGLDLHHASISTQYYSFSKFLQTIYSTLFLKFFFFKVSHCFQ
jgi:hypothetical protein